MKTLFRGVIAVLAAALASGASAGDPVDNYQSSIGIRYSVVTTGPMAGSIFMFAGQFDPYGTRAANGATLAIAGNSELYNEIGTTYGGNGLNTFALPNLLGRTPVGVSPANPLGTVSGTASYEITGAEIPPIMGGGGAAVPNMQPSLSLTAMIAATGAPSSFSGGGGAQLPYVGQVILSAGPASSYTGGAFEYLAANGQSVSTSTHDDLFDAIGYTYDDTPSGSTFALPDLSDRVAAGDGEGAALGSQSGSNEIFLFPSNIPAGGSDGAPYSNEQEELSLRYIICTSGLFPSQSGGPEAGSLEQGIIGQIALYAGDGSLPDGWAFADGSLLSIDLNSALYAVIGTAFGGDGSSFFALPDLTTYIPVGAGGEFQVGETFGSDFVALTPQQIPEPGACALLSLGLAGVLLGRRRRGVA